MRYAYYMALTFILPVAICGVSLRERPFKSVNGIRGKSLYAFALLCRFVGIAIMCDAGVFLELNSSIGSGPLALILTIFIRPVLAFRFIAQFAIGALVTSLSYRGRSSVHSA
jgi:hypothetical protein